MQVPTTTRDLMLAFSSLTGVRMKFLSYGQEQVAHQFLKHFELSDLTAVVTYIQAEIQRGKLDSRSLQWRCVFGEYGSGNELASFQDRLSLAQKTVRTRPAVRQVPVTTDVGDGKITRLDFAKEPEVSACDKATLDAQMEELRRWAKGGNAKTA